MTEYTVVSLLPPSSVSVSAHQMTLAFEGATIQSGFSTRSIPSRPHLMSLERARNQWYSYFIWGLHESQGQIQEAHNLVLLCPKGPSGHKFCLFHFLSRGEKTAGVNLKSSSRMPLDMLYKPYQNSVIIQWSSDPFLQTAVCEAGRVFFLSSHLS